MRKHILFSGIICLLLLVLVLPVVVLKYQNTTFADRYFSKTGLSYDRVLASKRWHEFNEDPFGCTYTIVSLDKERATEFPSVQWPSVSTPWIATPLQDQNALDILTRCQSQFSPGTLARLEIATKKEGSYYWKHTNEILYLYSKPAGIAAYIRYGD